MNITVNMEDLFAFLTPPGGSNNMQILHVPEMSVFMGNEYIEKIKLRDELTTYFDPTQFINEELYEQVLSTPSKKVPINKMGVGLNDVYMDLVPIDSLPQYLQGRIKKDPNMNISRTLIQPFFVAYQTRNYVISDPNNEMNLTRGIANIGPMNLLTNVGFLKYLMGWQKESNMPEHNGLVIKGVYEDHIKEIISKSKIIDKPPKTKQVINNLDIVFQGLNFVSCFLYLDLAR